MSHPNRTSGARSAAGHHAKRTNGSARAAMSGTPSILAAYVRRACTSGLKRSASHVAAGRRTRSGMQSNVFEKIHNTQA
jgi:hypothetical protein